MAVESPSGCGKLKWLWRSQVVVEKSSGAGVEKGMKEQTSTINLYGGFH